MRSKSLRGLCERYRYLLFNSMRLDNPNPCHTVSLHSALKREDREALKLHVHA
jgi:hypothetical protein